MLIEEIINNGIYIAYKVSPGTIGAITEWLKTLDIDPVPPDELHVTLVYSDVEKTFLETFKPLGKLSSPVVISLQDSFLDVFPRKNTSTNALVLRFKSNYLIKRRNQIRRDYNIKKWKERFSKYKPHLTISYDYKEKSPGDIDVALKSIKLIEEYTDILKK